MNIRALKTWQWIVVGTIAGLLIGSTRVMWNLQHSIGGRGFITQNLFEQAVLAPTINGRPYITDIVIHPCPSADGIDLVGLKAFDADTNSYRQYFFVAPRPFSPGVTGSSRERPSVADYLNDLAATNPALRPRYAWWDAPSFTIGLYVLVGGVGIGGLCSALMRLINGPSPQIPVYDLDRFKHESEPAQAHVTDLDKQHLRELEEEMRRGLEGSAAEIQPIGPEVIAPVRKLIDNRLEDLQPVVQDPKDFAGEFYPVEKHAPRAFSLVELIVVIGIVALLTAFALPSIRLARMSAQTVQCAAQLRDIGQALHAYASANHGSLPAWSNWHTWPPGLKGDTIGPAWTIELIPYIGKPDSPVYNCPSLPLPVRHRNYFLEAQWSARSGRNAMKLSEIKMSGRFVMSGDVTNLSHFPADAKFDDADSDDASGDMLLWPWTGGSYMHLGGNNVLFDDGHVSLCSRFNPSEMTFNPHRVQNQDNVTPD